MSPFPCLCFFCPEETKRKKKGLDGRDKSNGWLMLSIKS